VLRALAVMAAGLLLSLAFWFGWGPVRSPAMVSGSDYTGVSPISFAVVTFGVIVLGYGLAMLIRSRRRPD
jgi:hypothetical protein